MMETLHNEYKFDTEENREFSIRHIAGLARDGYTIIAVDDDETKTLVTLTKEELEEAWPASLTHRELLYIVKWYVEGAQAVLEGTLIAPPGRVSAHLRRAIHALNEGLELCEREV